MSQFRSHLARLQSFLLSTQPKYATQGATHRRTEDAIIQATKILISQSGLTKISMIDISVASEVARATLYNHFRDKQSVIEALLASEVARIIEVSKSAGTPADALESLSIAISLQVHGLEECVLNKQRCLFARLLWGERLYRLPQ